MKQVNAERQRNAPNHRFEGSSCSVTELKDNPALALDYIVAEPRMACYMEYSTRIYEIYLKRCV